MARSFPLTLGQFAGCLPVASSTLAPADNTIQTVTRGGEVLQAAVGASLWQGDVVLAEYRTPRMDEIRATLAMLRALGGSFLVAPFHRLGPIADPRGTILGGAAPKISSIAGNSRDLTIKSLPAGYVLSAGDFLSFLYGSAPTRYGFHQVAVGATANGSGVATVEVTPPIRPGAAADAAITLVRPVMKAVLTDPQFGTVSLRRSGGVSFSFAQTLG